MPTAIEFDEFTWTVAETKTVGRFLFGDPFVWGSTTWTAVEPACAVVNIEAPSIAAGVFDDYVINGSMRNPIPHGDYGFSSMINQYVAGGNVALGLSRILGSTGDDSIVSSICHTTRPMTEQGHIRKVGILTVLETAPADLTEGAYFCPYAYGSLPKELIRVDSVDWSFIPRRPALASSPTLATMQAYMTGLPWFEYHSAFWAYASIPSENLGTAGALDYFQTPSTYGKDMNAKWQNLALGIQTDQASEAEIRAIVLEIIQCGIHIIGASLNGLKWQGDGGHRQGRWFPAIVAAAMLHRTDWLAWISADLSRFAELGCVWSVTGADVGRVTNSGRTWTSNQIGMPEHGLKHEATNAPAADDPALPDGNYQAYNGWPVPVVVSGGSAQFYRLQNWGPQIGIALALRSMGMVVQANHTPFFEYENRWFNINVNGYADVPPLADFRAAYFADFGPLGPAVPTFNPPARGFEGPVDVEIILTPGSTGYFTTDGSAPTEEDPQVAGLISITDDVTLKVLCVHPGYAATSYRAGAYIIDTSGKPSAVSNASSMAL